MKFKPFSSAVVYFVCIILIAHAFAQPGYVWTQNTISDLAAQGHANKWIMQLGFIGFGVLPVAGVVSDLKRNPRLYFLYAVAAYGLAIFMTGIFCTVPIDTTLAYVVSEAELHSLFATIAGFGMTLGIGLQIIFSANNRERGMRVGFLILVIGFSALFDIAAGGDWEMDKGIFQRLLYLSGLAWLLYEEYILSHQPNLSRRHNQRHAIVGI